MNEPTQLSNYKPRLLNKCIYCGSTENLSDEHIIPHGLAGPWKLLKASCQNCCKITSAFEGEVLDSFFSLTRSTLRLPTYHAKNRPTEFQFKVKMGGEEQIVKMGASESPTLFMMPLFEPPGYITNDPNRTTLLITGMTMHGTPGSKDLIAKKKFDSFSFTVSMQGHNFARLIAKIAYCMAVANYGLDTIDEKYLLPSILGISGDIGRWVGCDKNKIPPNLPAKSNYFHVIEFFENKLPTTLRSGY
jgi:hypothetical protein